MHKGSCLCGGVTFEISGAMRPVIACHCGQCRKTSGHFAAFTQVDDSRLVLTFDETLRWYQSSDTATRGFCNRCGASLFWSEEGSEKTSVAAGAFDGPTGLTLTHHIYVADKGDYYDLNDGLPQS